MHRGFTTLTAATCDRYPRSSIKALAPGDAVRMATHFTPDMVHQASGYGSVRRVGPFEMRPAAGACEASVASLLPPCCETSGGEETPKPCKSKWQPRLLMIAWLLRWQALSWCWVVAWHFQCHSHTHKRLALHSQASRTGLCAAAVALAWYKQQAWREARRWVMDQVECDDVRSLHLEHTVLESRTSPVYVPAYIFRSRHLGKLAFAPIELVRGA